MADIVYTQLATRIPKELHKELKLHCATAEANLMTVVALALTEYLSKSKSKGKK